MLSEEGKLEIEGPRDRAGEFEPQLIREPKHQICRKYLSPNCAPDTARTCNLQFRRLSLYPIELRVLSVAEVDHMAQPGFGKAKMQGDQASVSASASSDGGPLCVEGRFGAFLLNSYSDF